MGFGGGGDAPPMSIGRVSARGLSNMEVAEPEEAVRDGNNALLFAFPIPSFQL